jgi:hypothetical protein
VEIWSIMAQLKNTNIENTLSLPVGTTAQRPTSPVQGMVRYNTTLNDTEYHDGSRWRSISDTGVEATGGTIVDTDIGGIAYRIHYFLDTGNTNFTVTKGGKVEYLIVAGGGGGSDTGSGGGGAGGLLQGTTTVTPQAYTITVGAGGAGTNSYFQGTSGLTGGKGGNSIAFGFTAFGGGGGGGYRSIANDPNLSGGSGGGHRGTSGGTGGTGVAGQGNPGGTSTLSNGNAASGGGGAGGPGGNAVIGLGGKGGIGLVSTITGFTKFYAGGGGGSGGYGNIVFSGPGGPGGGGHGGGLSRFIDDPVIQNGLPNSGGGGGGQGYDGDTAPVQGGGNGGSGIVIVRYPRSSGTTINPTRTTISTVPNNYDGIVRKNLVFNLDVADPVCYTGTGTSVKGLSGKSMSGTIYSGVTYTNDFGGLLRFDGTVNSYLQADVNTLTLNGNPNFTVDFFVRRIPGTNIGGAGAFWGFGGTGQGNSVSGWTPTANLIHLDFFDSSRFATSPSLFYPAGSFIHVCWVRSGGGTPSTSNIQCYVNGVNVGLTQTRSQTRTNQFNTSNAGIGVCLGRLNADSTANRAPADIGSFKVYNRALNVEEVQQNFNALRGRYGI